MVFGLRPAEISRSVNISGRNNHRVTDLGTKFVIRREPGEVKVSLMEGRAQFENIGETASKPAVLMPGDIVIANARDFSVARKPLRELDKALAWQHGMLVFSQTPLADVAAELNRYNTKKLVIADAAAQARIGGTFPTSGVEEVTAAARVLFGLHVEDQGNEIVISR